MKIEKEELKKQIRDLIRRGYLQPSEVPNIDLYIEQVIQLLDRYLSSYKRTDEEKTLTKTMVNNYTKNGLLPPPEKKRYNRDHIILLLLVYYMKSVLSISDIQALVDPLVRDYYQGREDDDTLMKVYETLYDLEKRQYFESQNSILKTLELSKRNTGDKDDEYLHNFVFLCLMGYDIFIKKKMMEHIIDDMQKEKEEKP